MELSQLIRFSPKRSSLFAALQAQVSSSAPTMKPLCPTRWTVRTKAIEAVLANYQLLLDALEVIEVMNDVTSSKTMFSEVRTVLHTVLTIPVTTSTAERTFLTLRCLKTFLRSTMTQPRLNHIMLLHIYKEKTDKLNLLSIATKFVAVNDRRKALFWKVLIFCGLIPCKNLYQLVLFVVICAI